MKKLILHVFVVLSYTALSQVIDYNKIILPTSAKEISIEERLVQIAWNNHPSVNRAKNQIQVAEHDLRKTKGSWLNSFTIAGNLNEFTIRGRDENLPNNFFPRYNISASFSLGRFISTPADIKMAREALEIQNEDLNSLKLQIRSSVLKLFSEYKTNYALLSIQRDYSSDIEAQFRLVEVKFKNGESSITEYNLIRDRYDNQRIRLLNAENSFLKSKYELEELLGVNIDEIL